jgi:hypothetical protein
MNKQTLLLHLQNIAKAVENAAKTLLSSSVAHDDEQALLNTVKSDPTLSKDLSAVNRIASDIAPILDVVSTVDPALAPASVVVNTVETLSAPEVKN